MGLISKLREITGKHSERLQMRIVCFSLALLLFLQTPVNGSFRDISVVYWAPRNERKETNRTLIWAYVPF